jgi:hypothetical protein
MTHFFKMKNNIVHSLEMFVNEQASESRNDVIKSLSYLFVLSQDITDQ